MHDFFKNIAENNKWHFEYARKDYLNLFEDVEEDNIYLMVEPITSDSTFTDSGNETITYSGKLFLVISSDVDEEYHEKYEHYIKPLFANARETFIDAFACSSYDIKSFRCTEIINLFDQNLDGLLINYSATYVE